MTNDARHNTTSITGGTFIGSSVGSGSVHNHADVRVGVIATGSVQDLRTLLAQSREVLVGSAPTEEERVVVGYELRKLDEELGSPEPRPDQVRSGWGRIRDVLAAVTSGSTALTDATTAVGGLVGTLFGG